MMKETSPINTITFMNLHYTGWNITIPKPTSLNSEYRFANLSIKSLVDTININIEFLCDHEKNRNKFIICLEENCPIKEKESK